VAPVCLILGDIMGAIKTAEQRKQDSIAFLKSKGVPVMEHLPVIEEYGEVILRSTDDIAKRAIALMIVAIHAECLNSEMDLSEIKNIQTGLLDRYKPYEFFTPKESAFLKEILPGYDAVFFSWQYECLNVMLWTLGFIDNLAFPNEICDVANIVGIIHRHTVYDSFLDACVLRSKEEILDEADLIYRYNWACVNERINGRSIETINPGVVVERHRALNWLINYCNQDWDNITTDT